MTPTKSQPPGRPASAGRNADVLCRTRRVASNLWWTWNHDAQRLFASLDPKLWEATGHNPIKTLRLLPEERRAALLTDANFAAHLDHVERELQIYLDASTWYRGLGVSPERSRRSRSASNRSFSNRSAGALGQDAQATNDLLVAYFCAEFAIHESLPQYSGGLGVLAGDHVKSASDLGIPFVGVGLLYRNGFYTQEFAPDGSTRVIYPTIDFADCPITDTGHVIDIPMARRTVKAKIWRQQVGRVALFLLDTDIPANNVKDRALTRHLYGGDREYRIQQEILLGVGGVRALRALNLQPTVFHLNEGHAAFCALERLAVFVESGASTDDATERVQRTTVFTTHTPVSAGNDRFEPKLALKYIGHYADAIGISASDLLALGREDPRDANEQFCMTVIALNLADHRNGVAELHGETSRQMWTRWFDNAAWASRPSDRSAAAPRQLSGKMPNPRPSQVPITSITNGVHSQTWMPEEIIPLFDRYLKPRWLGAGPKQHWWKNAAKIPDAELWKVQQTLRSKLVCYARDRLMNQLTRQHAPLDERIAARTVLSPHALTLGFARRFATYKRAPLIFTDKKRLARILGDAKRPVQILFAGKAHPQDLGGQQYAQEIFQYARRPEFRDRVVILDDYDMALGRALTSGVDVWLNNPLRPQEASGTSGMKPPLHGGLNCSILDGWWPEAFNHKNGWSIGDGREFKSRAQQDRHDAAALYDVLENQIIPQFYARDASGLPRQWIARMKNSIATVCREFNTHRMVGQYFEQFYQPASRS